MLVYCGGRYQKAYGNECQNGFIIQGLLSPPASITRHTFHHYLEKLVCEGRPKTLEKLCGCTLLYRSGITVSTAIINQDP